MVMVWSRTHARAYTKASTIINICRSNRSDASGTTVAAIEDTAVPQFTAALSCGAAAAAASASRRVAGAVTQSSCSCWHDDERCNRTSGTRLATDARVVVATAATRSTGDQSTQWRTRRQRRTRNAAPVSKRSLSDVKELLPIRQNATSPI